VKLDLAYVNSVNISSTNKIKTKINTQTIKVNDYQKTINKPKSFDKDIIFKIFDLIV
jgi:hypothetical protein